MNRFKLGEPLDSVVRKHLLTLTKPLDDDDIEIAIHKGWTARDSEVEQLKAESTRYREALEFYAKKTLDCSDDVEWLESDEYKECYNYFTGRRAREALKGE